MINSHRFQAVCLLTTAAACHPLLGAEPLAEPASHDGKIIHRLDYGDAAEARRAWQPVYGSVPPSVARAGSRNVLELPCVFKDNRLERGNWEWSVDLDLTACRGVELQLYCRDVSPISNFTLYFQSGQGWYGLNFNPEYAGRWVRIVLDKSRAVLEGTPAGWGKIGKVRFSAWRGDDADTTVYLADLAMVGADAQIVVVQPGQAHRIGQVVVEALQRYDVPYILVPGSEITPELLHGRRLVALLGERHSLAEPARGYIENFGGKVVSLETVSDDLARTSAPDFRRYLLIMRWLGNAYPALWQKAAQRAIARAGEIAGYASTNAAIEAIREAVEDDPERKAAVHARLERALSLREEAAAQADGEPHEAVKSAELAREIFIDAYCLAQSPRAGEHRAFWCHQAYGVKGMSWDESIRILAENGFTAILPNMLWAGVAYYDSDILPVSPEVAARGNPLTECLEACRKYNVECHVWKVNFYMSRRSPEEFRNRMKQEGRALVEFDGKTRDDWLCPSHPDNRRLEIDSMVELATRYDVHGIHFDYIRYPGQESCFCDGCRRRFEEAIGKSVANWPDDTRWKPEIREQWLEWRRSNITAVVAGVAERVRTARPEEKMGARPRISAAVFRTWPSDRDTVGQDWKHWCDQGYLDFVCPMDYTPNVPQFRGMVRRQQEWAGAVPCYPGIGLSVWPDRNDVCRLIDQINITRELNTGGFTIFNYAENEARYILPMLGKGVTRRE